MLGKSNNQASNKNNGSLDLLEYFRLDETIIGKKNSGDRIVERSWEYNPKEESHKELPYPYCS